jgi:hypothetical protein
MVHRTNALWAAYHGGGCCGMSHIYSFPPTPETPLCERAAVTDLNTTYTAQPYGPRHLAMQALPEETGVERLKRLIDVIEDGTVVEAECGADCCGYETDGDGRPYGIIEVVLTEGQAKLWEKTLLSLDFKEVNRCKNSNSMNVIIVYHRSKQE